MPKEMNNQKMVKNSLIWARHRKIVSGTSEWRLILHYTEKSYVRKCIKSSIEKEMVEGLGQFHLLKRNYIDGCGCEFIYRHASLLQR